MEQEDYIELVEKYLDKLWGYSNGAFGIYGFEDYQVVKDIAENSNEYSKAGFKNFLEVTIQQIDVVRKSLEETLNKLDGGV